MAGLVPGSYLNGNIPESRSLNPGALDRKPGSGSDRVDRLETGSPGLHPLCGMDCLNGIAVRPNGHPVDRKERLVFTGEHEPTPVGGEVQWGISDTVSRQHQPAAGTIPERKRELAGDLLESLVP